jgi:predicted RNA binding protein YcfA (HicA-like mRNA interferase family)
MAGNASFIRPGMSVALVSVTDMKPSKLLPKIMSGCVANILFSDIITLIGALGFAEVGGQGSHGVFARPGITEIITLQEVGGQAKPYQVRQVASLIRRYNLAQEVQS